MFYSRSNSYRRQILTRVDFFSTSITYRRQLLTATYNECSPIF
jgi:hypothetical protein